MDCLGSLLSPDTGSMKLCEAKWLRCLPTPTVNPRTASTYRHPLSQIISLSALPMQCPRNTQNYFRRKRSGQVSADSEPEAEVHSGRLFK